MSPPTPYFLFFFLFFERPKFFAGASHFLWGRPKFLFWASPQICFERPKKLVLGRPPQKNLGRSKQILGTPPQKIGYTNGAQVVARVPG